MVDTVFIIDDDKATRYIHSRIIANTTKFKNIVPFPGGKVALDYLRSMDVNSIKKPRLILLDLNMPSMDGWEFIEEYKLLDSTITHHTKLIILSTSEDPNDIERSKKIKRVNEYISKPLTKPILDKILKTHFLKVAQKYKTKNPTNLLRNN